MSNFWLIGIAFVLGLLAGGLIMLVLRIATRAQAPPPQPAPDPYEKLAQALRDVADAIRETAADEAQRSAETERAWKQAATAIGSVSGHLEAMTLALAEQKRERPVPVVAAAAAVASAVPAEPPAKALPRQEPPPLLRGGERLEQIIRDNFRAIDLETRREFGAFSKRFLQLLGSRVADLRDEGGVALFVDAAGPTQAWPWPNAYLGRPWRDFFELPRGVNHAVVKVLRPALVEEVAGDWRLIEKGAVQQ